MNLYSVDDVRCQFSSLPLVGRVGEADEVSRAIAFLASDESGFITGTELVVDGGHLVR